MAKHSKAHPGFAATASKIAHSKHIPMKNARAILASHTRRASVKARKANPRLKKVKG